MVQPWRTHRAYILPLFAGYILLFLVLHWPVREPAIGVLALPSVQYLPAALAWNPLQILAGWLGVAAQSAANIGLLLVFALLFVVWWRALQAAETETATSRALIGILLGTICFAVPLLLLPYLLSSDIYIYIIRGRISAVYGGNPMLDPASLYPNDPFLAYLPHWRENAPLYGPVWMAFGRVLTQIAGVLGGAVWLYIVLYKLASLGLHLLSTTLVWSLLGRWKPAQQLRGTLMYAWSPLLLIELVGSAHNDALMLAFLLAGLWLAQRNHWYGAALALLLAAFAKYTAAPVLAVYSIFAIARVSTWQRQLVRATQIGAGLLVCAVVLYLPFWQGSALPQIVATSEVSQWSINSPSELIVRGVPALLQRLRRNGDQAHTQFVVEQAMALVTKLLWVLFIGVAAVAVWRKPTFERFVHASGWMLLCGVLFATAWFWPWYVTWPLAFAPFLAWRTYGRVTTLFSASAMMIYVAWPGRPLFAFLPPMLWLGWSIWEQYSTRNAQGRAVYSAYSTARSCATTLQSLPVLKASRRPPAFSKAGRSVPARENSND